MLDCCNFVLIIISIFIGTLLHAWVVATAIKCAQYLLDLGIDRTFTNNEGDLAHEMEPHDDNFDEIKNLVQNYVELPLIKEHEEH